jgi:hypothetical protein
MPTRSAFLASAGVRTDRDVDIRLQEPNRRPVEYRRILQTIRGPVVYQRQVPPAGRTEDDGILTNPKSPLSIGQDTLTTSHRIRRCRIAGH